MTPVQNDLATTNNKANDINPIHLAEWSIDGMIEKTTSYLHTLMYVKNLTPEQLEHLYKVRLHELKAYRSIHNIAELYGGEDSISSLKIATYNAEHFLKSVVNQTLKMFDDSTLEIFFDCSESCRSVMFDIRRMSLIIFNLISNAILHNRKSEKQIHIEAFIRGDDLVVTLRDNGRVIKESIRKTMFSAYEANIISRNTEKTSGGLILTGMGLAVSRKAATDMGGKLIYLPSKSGNVFELTIPQRHQLSSIHETQDCEPEVGDIELFLSSAILYHKYGE